MSRAMVNKAGRVRRQAVKKLEVDEALIALFIGAMDANEHTVLTQCGQQVAPTNINADGATAERIRR